ncbi:MAG TPA: hypothetical protein VGL89_08175 [Candidatus Koribacter sp.]
MMDPLRNEYAPPNTPLETENPRERSPLDTQSIDELLAGFPPEQALPAAQNPRLNQAAESIGSALGTTIGKVRHGISLVQNRQRSNGPSASERVSQQAETFTAAITEKAEQLGDLAEEKASEFVDMAQERWQRVSQTAQERWSEARRMARRRIVDVREQAAHLRDDRPIELILSFAGAAFVLGFALRVWRSTHD